MRGKPWGEFETARLRSLVAQGYTQADLARYFGRHQSSVARKLLKLGIVPQRYAGHHWIPQNTDRDSWTEADRICAYANVPLQIANIVVDAAFRHSFSVKCLRSSARTADLVECRTEITARARELGFSYPIIGRALNRDHSSVIHLAQRIAA